MRSCLSQLKPHGLGEPSLPSARPPKRSRGGEAQLTPQTTTFMTEFMARTLLFLTACQMLLQKTVLFSSLATLGCRSPKAALASADDRTPKPSKPASSALVSSPCPGAGASQDPISADGRIPSSCDGAWKRHSAAGVAP